MDTHRYNTLVNTAVEGFWGFGLSFHNIYAVVPLFIAHLGAPMWLVSIIPAFFLFLIGIPQFLSAFINRDPRKLFRTNLLNHYFMAIPASLMFVTFFLLKLDEITGLKIYLILLVIYAFGVGFLLPVWADFLQSVSYSGKRGQFLGWTFLSSSMMGFLGGLVLHHLISILPFPQSFGLGFGILTLSILIGSSFFFLMRRNQTSEPVKSMPNSLRQFFQEMAQILRKNRDFRLYIITRSLFAFFLLASAFFAVYCKQKLQLPLSVSGSFTAIITFSAGISSILLGRIGDHFGYKIVIAIIYSGYLLATLLTFVVTSYLIAVLIFILAGISNGGMFTGFMNVIFQFAEPGRTKLYYSMVDSLLAPVMLMIQLTGSMLITFTSLPVVFGVCALSIATALFILIRYVHIPHIQDNSLAS